MTRDCEAAVSCCNLEPLVAVILFKNRCSSVEDVERSFPVGLGVVASSHPHLKEIARTTCTVLRERFMLGLGEGGMGCWRGGGEASPLEGKSGCSSRRRMS